MSDPNITAEIVADSINTETGDRITTVQATFHRFVLAEYNTHASIKKNSASSRAIPVKKQLANVRENPALPVVWGRNQSGMQAGENFEDRTELDAIWLAARDDALRHCEALLELGVHKQWANRLLEPFMWHTVVATATDLGWLNFFNQRCSPLAQPEMHAAADAIREVYDSSVPVERVLHLPYVSDDEDFGRFDNTIDVALAVSTARCARVSYKAFDGSSSVAQDVDLFIRLMSASPWHASPLEHVARVGDGQRLAPGPYQGWTSLRHHAMLEPLLGRFGVTFDSNINLIF